MDGRHDRKGGGGWCADWKMEKPPPPSPPKKEKKIPQHCRNPLCCNDTIGGMHNNVDPHFWPPEHGRGEMMGEMEVGERATYASFRTGQTGTKKYRHNPRKPTQGRKSNLARHTSPENCPSVPRSSTMQDEKERNLKRSKDDQSAKTGGGAENTRRERESERKRKGDRRDTPPPFLFISTHPLCFKQSRLINFKFDDTAGYCT